MTDILSILAAGGDLGTVVIAYGLMKLYKAVVGLDRRMLVIETLYGEKK